MADDKSTSSTGAPAESVSGQASSPLFRFPRFTDKCRYFNHGGELSGLPLLSKTKTYRFSAPQIPSEDESYLGDELAAHYVQYVIDNREFGCINILGNELLPALSEAPRAVQISFFSTIEKLLTDHVSEPFDAVAKYAREEHREVGYKADVSELAKYPLTIDDVYSALDRIETTAKTLALAVSTEKLEIADGVTSVCFLDEQTRAAMELCAKVETGDTKTACEALLQMIGDAHQVFNENLEFRLPTSVEQHTADKLAELATVAIDTLNRHTDIGQVKAVA